MTIRFCLPVLALVAFASACAPDPAAPPQRDTPPAAAVDTSRAEVTGRTTAGAVVMLEPRGEPVPLPEGPALMDQYGKAFVPDVLFVRVGQLVEFRNSEDVDHNVRVLRNPTGTMVMDESGSKGQVFTHTFDRPGTYEVTCDVHPGMRALIVASRTPFAAETDAQGRFTVSNVPAGTYTLTTLVAGKETSREVTIVGPRTDLGDS